MKHATKGWQLNLKASRWSQLWGSICCLLGKRKKIHWSFQSIINLLRAAAVIRFHFYFFNLISLHNPRFASGVHVANLSPICLFMRAQSQTEWTIHQNTSRQEGLSFSSFLLTLFNTSSLHQRAECVCWCVKAVAMEKKNLHKKTNAVPGLVVTVMDHHEEFIVITSSVTLNGGTDRGLVLIGS